MREIRFRYWLKSEKKMHNVACVFNRFSDEDFNRVYIARATGIDDARNYKDDGKMGVLMQSTGIKDKTGKEIFDRDIVNVDNSDPNENGGYDVITLCVWEKGQFNLIDKANGYWTRQLYHQQYRLTVIGNKFENPELLK